ncbi:MAG: hypothetical protein ABIO37_00360 [Caulobacteraceae bacterium]
MSSRARLSPIAFTLAMLAASGALAEANITGMWAVSQPEGKVHQAPPPLTDAAKAQQAQTQKISASNNRLIGEAHTKCWPAGMPGLMQPPFGIEFLQTKERITILSEVSNLPRTIYLDEKTHPEGVLPGWNGHSIGHWEGNVLVVDTIGFNGRNNRVSEKMHITEKLFLDKEGYLVDEMTLDDPVNYTEPYHVRYRYKRAPEGVASEVMEYVCEVDPANLVAFEAEQKAAGLASDYDPAWSAAAFSNPVPVKTTTASAK